MSKKELDKELYKYAKEHGEEKTIDYLSLKLLALMKASNIHRKDGICHLVLDFKEFGKVVASTE